MFSFTWYIQEYCIHITISIFAFFTKVHCYTLNQTCLVACIWKNYIRDALRNTFPHQTPLPKMYQLHHWIVQFRINKSISSPECMKLVWSFWQNLAIRFSKLSLLSMTNHSNSTTADSFITLVTINNYI